MKRAKQTSESIELGVLLAMAGGFMDAYSYVCRDHVFANAQTGNMLLFGINLSSGNYHAALRYLMPVLAFAAGIALADTIRHHLLEMQRLHWRQIAVLCEALLLCSVAFIPQSMNLLANTITSFACGIQVQSFRKIHGNGIATTMCIGNLRSGTSAMTEYWHTGNKEAAERGLLFYGIIAFFIIGAVIGNQVILQVQEKAILVCAALQLLAFALMFIHRKEEESALF